MNSHTTDREVTELREKFTRLNSYALAARLRGDGEAEREILRAAKPIRKWMKEVGA